jgi:hypothetical protein
MDNISKSVNYLNKVQKPKVKNLVILSLLKGCKKGKTLHMENMHVNPVRAASSPALNKIHTCRIHCMVLKYTSNY